MNEIEFVAKWESERDMYLSWGHFIVTQISKRLLEEDENLNLSKFLKIPAQPRAKEIDSLLGKAFHRNKKYNDPYSEIEDKVGVRFVVLLTSDIKKLSQVIEESNFWKWSLDKDYEVDREKRPLEFTYQSMHYVLRSTSEIDLGNGMIIRCDTPCEVQLRTLLQHAHSELTHDSIYKREPGAKVNKKVERTVAKSMALIEAVDEYFISAMDDLDAETRQERNALEVLARIFKEKVDMVPSIDKTNILVLQAFNKYIDSNLRQSILNLLEKKPTILLMIREHFDSQYIYRQPWILFAYFLVWTQPAQTAENWPLTPSELKPVYNDLGIRFPMVE